MFSSLLRPSRSQRRRSRIDRPSSDSPSTHRRDFSSISRNIRRSRPRSYNSAEDDDIAEEDDENEGDFEEVEDEEDADDTTPLLPIFSSSHLNAIPVYTLTHVFREQVVTRCETVLSWDQLRSPQVTQFLLKPIQQQIKADHFNAGTMYALLANCLQFNKEVTMFPGNSGISKTRAMLCELIAIRLLREYSTRELIDALCYDFDPLQGHTEATPPAPNGNIQQMVQRKPQHRVARISCYEVALRAQSKRFLAHPLVVQQLEAIWAGTIVFHSAADSMHRKLPLLRQHPTYGTSVNANSAKLGPSQPDPALLRRAVTIYNPKEASLFKLSRLRVPRYRNVLSTLSFAVLLGLFLAVLIERSLEISTLEVFFWFWAAGYMLDEIVGFNEQGFSLYIASFWNTFDLGILLILFAHLCLRIYGIVMPDDRKHTTANLAYDVLAADAILLFPRLFSVLDHYRYFSQLLIAFRMMAQDLVAIFLLIIISCSGFFIALTLSFGNGDNLDTPRNVAYALLQILMGFTPAAWDRWPAYNALGKAILTLFLFICHFLVVTILITVLTNSFMAIVQNANEEHQFVFAVNTISSVKSDALFSYVAPTNVIQWVVTPLRYCLPFRQYVKINRWIIKITHFPILFSIYFYERMVLRPAVYDTIDVVEDRGRPKKSYAPRLPRLVREPSIATFRQDRALEEVFKQPADSTMRTTLQSTERKTSNVVKNWMRTMGDDEPPLEQDRRIVDRLERRHSSKYLRPINNRGRNSIRRTMSVASDPEDFMTNADLLSSGRSPLPEQTTPSHLEEPSQHTDADGDDELPTDDYDEDDRETIDRISQAPARDAMAQPLVLRPIDYFTRKSTPLSRTPEAPRSIASNSHLTRYQQASGMETPSRSSTKREPRQHLRNVSSATMIYKPIESVMNQPDASVPFLATKDPVTAPASGAVSPVNKSNSSGLGARTPKRPKPGVTRMRPILPTQDNPAFRSAPDLAGLLGMKQAGRQERQRAGSLEMDLVSDIGDNKAIGGGYVGALPASFATQMHASAAAREKQERKEEQERLSRLMMARMNSLEEGFREVIHEMRETMGGQSRNSRNPSPQRVPRPAQREKRFKEKKEHTSGAGSAAGSTAGGDKENIGPVQAVSNEVVKHDPPNQSQEGAINPRESVKHGDGV